ncbi:MAG: hypothetical protein LBT40_12245 [Deltaproteobacteria bacterium]|jgi:hypothetical protein|nr:hypothetical protein [Deltaproteobacteria bacterium]
MRYLNAFIDGNGNDLRYGRYFFGTWVPDPPEVVELKKSGDWYRMLKIHQEWILDGCVQFDAETNARIDEINHESFLRNKERQMKKT